MTAFTASAPPVAAGFRTVAGPEQRLRRLLYVSGRLPVSASGVRHTHADDEIIRIVSGRVLMRVADAREECGAGDVVIIPPDVPHGFRTLTEVLLEVVAEQQMGTFYPVPDDHGGQRLIEVLRPDHPWSRTPQSPAGWTSDEKLARITAAITLTV